AVVGGCALGDQPEFADLGLHGGLAHDRPDPRGEAHHLPDPGPPFRGGEVGAHPGAQVDALADVEGGARGVLEEVDPRGLGQPVGQVPSAALLGGGRAAQRPQLLPGVHAAGAQPGQQAAQHARGGAGEGQRIPWEAHAAFRRATSNGALWATRTVSGPKPANSRNAGSTAAAGGADSTMAVVMPVSRVTDAGTGVCGFTSELNSSRTRPSRRRTAPISVIAASPGRAPVVSRSTTTNVVAASGVPSSSREPWTG